jgi:hypothetical protein
MQRTACPFDRSGGNRPLCRTTGMHCTADTPRNKQPGKEAHVYPLLRRVLRPRGIHLHMVSQAARQADRSTGRRHTADHRRSVPRKASGLRTDQPERSLGGMRGLCSVAQLRSAFPGNAGSCGHCTANRLAQLTGVPVRRQLRVFGRCRGSCGRLTMLTIVAEPGILRAVPLG